jgi:hypothetical protein
MLINEYKIFKKGKKELVSHNIFFGTGTTIQKIMFKTLD